MLRRNELQPLHLILQRNRTKFLINGPLPIPATARRSTVVHRHDEEALVRKPLREQPLSHDGNHLQAVRSPIDVKNNGVLPGTIERPRLNEGCMEAAFPSEFLDHDGRFHIGLNRY